MDVFSHGLWGAIAYGRKNRRSFWLAFFFGIFPDIVAFAPYTLATLLGLIPKTWSFGEPPDPSTIPAYVYNVYNFSHSLIIFTLVFFTVWLLTRRPVYELLAWPLHILVDIPTHSSVFFPTPFLWPLSSFHINGIPWGEPIIFVPNVIILSLLYFWYFIIRPRMSKNKTLKT